jgi:hypothetical protein
MRYLAVLGVWILGTCVAASGNDETRYLVTHQEADSRFINAIERVGDCKIPGAPLAIKKSSECQTGYIQPCLPHSTRKVPSRCC